MFQMENNRLKKKAYKQKWLQNLWDVSTSVLNITKKLLVLKF